MNTSIWAVVRRHHAWFTAVQVDPSFFTPVLFVAKLSEEVGEYAQAQAGGVNPKSGVAFSDEDAAHELCDVIITALMGLRSVVKDSEACYVRYQTGSDVRQVAAAVSAPTLLTRLAVALGQVGDAVSGATGFTPRKGVYSDAARLGDRLCAVAYTARLGLGLLVKDPEAFLVAHLEHGETRRLATQMPPSPSGLSLSPPYAGSIG